MYLVLVDAMDWSIVTEFVKVPDEFDTHLQYFDLLIKNALNYNSFSFLKIEAYRNWQWYDLNLFKWYYFHVCTIFSFLIFVKELEMLPKLSQNQPLMFRSSHFWFLVFGHFWRWSYKNTKILGNLCLHFARQDGQDGKKSERKSRN